LDILNRYSIFGWSFCFVFMPKMTNKQILKKAVKLYKVVTLMRDLTHYPGNWTLTHWYDLQEDLNNGWVIERTDSFSGGGGWHPVSGAIVYILSKSFKNL